MTALAAYKKLLTIMPDDLGAYRLAQIYGDLEEYDKAVPTLEENKLLAVNNEQYIRLLALYCACAGADSKVEAILDNYLRNKPSASPDFLYFGAVYATGKNKWNEAFSLIDRMHSQYPNSLNVFQYCKGPIFFSQDDFENAEQEFWAVAGRCSETEKINGFLSLQGLYLTQGKLSDAANQARLAVD